MKRHWQYVAQPLEGKTPNPVALFLPKTPAGPVIGTSRYRYFCSRINLCMAFIKGENN